MCTQAKAHTHIHIHTGHPFPSPHKHAHALLLPPPGHELRQRPSGLLSSAHARASHTPQKAQHEQLHQQQKQRSASVATLLHPDDSLDVAVSEGGSAGADAQRPAWSMAATLKSRSLSDRCVQYSRARCVACQQTACHPCQQTAGHPCHQTACASMSAEHSCMLQ